MAQLLQRSGEEKKTDKKSNKHKEEKEATPGNHSIFTVGLSESQTSFMCCWKPKRGVITLVSSLWWCRVSVSLATHGLPPWRHWCAVGVFAGTHQCRANPVRAVGASPVVLSPLANVFVSLSSVMVFHIVKLVILQTIVTLVLCGMLEYLHSCSTKCAALQTHCRFQLSHSFLQCHS